MRKWLVLFSALCLLIPLSVQAQGTVALDSLKIRLWSEYDQPSMLVIYEFNVTSDTLVPTSVDIKIPKTANIIAVAYEENGELLNADFKGPVEDDRWQVITFLVQSQNIYRLEYYQPLVRKGDLRKFSQEWAGEYAVNDFSIELQIPLDSTGIQTDPAIPFVQEQTSLSGGAMKGGLEAGQPYQVNLQYIRTSEELSISSSPPVEPSMPLTSDAEGRVSLNNLPYILGGIGVLLVGAALVYAWRANASHSQKPRSRRRSTTQENTIIYCHECGARAQAGDRFCRTCGNKLRSE